MNAEKLDETLDMWLWGLFVELVLSVAVIFELDPDELFEKILTNEEARGLMAKLMDVKGLSMPDENVNFNYLINKEL